MSREYESADPSGLFRFFQEISIIHQLATTELQKVIGAKLGYGEFALLSHMMRMGDGKTISDLARIMQVRKPTMSATVSSLHTKGYIATRACSDDKRVKYVHLTARGRRVWEQAIAAVAPLLEELGAEFPVDDLKAIEPVLADLRAFMDARRDRPRQ